MLVGRGRECARIDQLLAATRAGAGGTLVLCGEPGIGKTSLLRYAADHAADSRVLSVAAAESETVLAFAALGRLLTPLLVGLGSLPTRQATALRGALALDVAQPGDRFAVYTATFGLLTGTGEAVPTLILVDDAQWLDQPTAEALTFSARRLRSEGIAILVGTRTPGAFAEFERVQVGGLSDSASAAVLAHQGSCAPAADVARVLVTELGGNPLALLEIADSLSAEEMAGRQPLRRPLPARATAHRIFGRRIEGLDQATREVLRVAAVAEGDGLTQVAPILDAVGLDPALLERLEEAGLITATEGRLRFTHPLVRTAALADLPGAQLRALHRRVSGVLTGPADVVRRAWHMAEAAFGPDEDAAVALEHVAALDRDRRAFAAAALALQRAAQLSTDGRGAARRFLAAADAAARGGRVELALRLLSEGQVRDSDPRIQAVIAAARGRIDLRSGRPTQARATLLAGAAAIAASDPPTAGALSAMAAAAAFYAGDPAHALRLARQADAWAGHGDRNTALGVKLVTGVSLQALGHGPEGARELLGAAALLQRLGPESFDPDFVITAAQFLVWVGETSTARALLDPLVHDLRADAALGQLPFALHVSALVDTCLGRLSRARMLAVEAADLAEATGELMTRVPALGCLALVEGQLGDEQACRAHAAESSRLRPPDVLAEINRGAWNALGLLELSLGRPERAISHLEQGNRGQAALADLPIMGRPSSIDLLEAYIQSGTPVPPNTLEQLHRLTDPTAQTPAISVAWRGLAWRGRALLADPTDFDYCFVRALELHARADTTFDTARTELCYGERLRRAGRRRDARKHLSTAHDIFSVIGARIWAQRATTELSAAGQPVADSQRPTPMAPIGETLTAQELQVAAIAANGNTNREIAGQLFLSVKTIEMHLSRVYRKLNVRSRTELANVLHNHQTA